jgi:hypothetical protein
MMNPHIPSTLALNLPVIPDAAGNPQPLASMVTILTQRMIDTLLALHPGLSLAHTHEQVQPYDAMNLARTLPPAPPNPALPAVVYTCSTLYTYLHALEDLPRVRDVLLVTPAAQDLLQWDVLRLACTPVNPLMLIHHDDYLRVQCAFLQCFLRAHPNALSGDGNSSGTSAMGGNSASSTGAISNSSSSNSLSTTASTTSNASVSRVGTVMETVLDPVRWMRADGTFVCAAAQWSFTLSESGVPVYGMLVFYPVVQ